MIKAIPPILACFVWGAVAALALAPLSLTGAFFISFAAFILLLKKTDDVKDTFLRAFCYALGFHAFGLYWISASLFIDIGKYFFVLPFSLLALPAYLAFLFAMAATTALPFKKNRITYAVMLPTLIFFSEVVRATALTGFPWNLFGTVWADNPAMLQSTSLFGVYGLTLLTLLAASSLSLMVDKPARHEVIMFAILWLLCAGLGFWGQQRLDQTITTHVDGITLRLVQGAVEQKDRRTYEQREAAFAHYLDLSKIKTDNPPTHIIWPETATPFFINTSENIRKILQKIVPQGGALITGAPLKNGDAFYNGLAALDDAGNLVARYEKARLVPFGEFIPLRDLWSAFPIAADVIGGQSDFSRGDGPRTLRARSLPPFSPMICYESIFSGGVVDKKDRPEFLLQVTNDGWFGDTSGPHQHFAMARMRAVEEGLPLVRSANTGISAVVDALGRTEKLLPLGAQGVLDAPLPKPLASPTLFSLYGNFPAFALALMIFIGVLLLQTHKKTGRK